MVLHNQALQVLDILNVFVLAKSESIRLGIAQITMTDHDRP